MEHIPKRLEGRRALVTGAGSGIGQDVAIEFARQGANVAVHFNVSRDGAMQTVAEIQRQGCTAHAFQADLSNPSECSRLVESAAQFLGGIDTLMNNAGRTVVGSFVDTQPSEFEALYRTNVGSQFFCAQAVVRQMLDRHIRGVIINMASIHATSGFPGHSVYAGTKGAVWAWTRELAAELAPTGIRVNGIAPGWVWVPGHFRRVAHFDPVDAGKRMVPSGRLGTPSDVAKACVYLASSESDYMLGHVLVIDGGVTAKSALRLEDLG